MGVPYSIRRLVYKTFIISTIVDIRLTLSYAEVYKTFIISTIVDCMKYNPSSKVSIRHL